MNESWSFTRGLLLGAGLMYLKGRDPRNRAHGRVAEAVYRLARGDAPDVRRWMPGGWPPALQYLAGALGAVAIAYGAQRAIQAGRSGETENRVAPNYAYLR